MKIFQNFILSFFVMAIMTVSFLAYAQGEHAGHNDHETNDFLSLNDGALWETDAHLRIAMENIRNAASSFEELKDNNASSMDRAKELSKQIDEQINYMVANCHLSPEADATLHVFLGDFLEGAELGIENPDSDKGIMKIKHALHQYPRYFNHPGWNVSLESLDE